VGEMVVTNQKEWDDIPKEFNGYIYVKSAGTKIIIAERKGLRVVAWGNSSVEAWGNSSVVAWGNSSVVARGNSSVEAWGNSSVEAWGNVQIAKYSEIANLTISGNARIVTLPQTVQEYCDFYGITVKDGAAILYKGVRPDMVSFYDNSFKYSIGATATNKCDWDVNDQCSYGLHVSHLHWALNFMRDKREFAILECAVPLNKIVIPTNTDGKVRTSELTVLREVPPEEWGIYGKIYAKRQRKEGGA